MRYTSRMAHKSTPHITCSKCKGSGKVRLSGVLLKTLEAVKKNPRKSPLELWEIMGCSDEVVLTAINGRLSKLLNLGLITHTKSGRFYRYSAVKTPIHD